MSKVTRVPSTSNATIVSPLTGTGAVDVDSTITSPLTGTGAVDVDSTITSPLTGTGAVDVDATITSPLTGTGAVDIDSTIVGPLTGTGAVDVDATITSPLSTTINGVTSVLTVNGLTDTQTVHIDTGNVATQTAFMLIDLSDTTNWKHTNTGHIVIDYILLQADPDSTYLGEVRIGFLKNVDATNGDFIGIFDLDLAKKSDLIVEELEFGSHGFHCQESTHFGPTQADLTLFQTDVDLMGPDSAISYPSGNGDLVMIVDRSSGAVDVSITLGYETIA